MQDRAWHEVYEAVLPLLRPDDVVLAPPGDWPDFPCTLLQQDRPDALDGATVLLLHKGRMAAIPKPALAAFMRRARCVHANEVFAALSVTAAPAWTLARLRHERHLLAVRQYLNARRLRQRAGTIWFVHVPKTGGTSLWALLSRAFPSCVYYADLPAYLANPPEPGEYDLVGLHFPPSVLGDRLRAGDSVIGMLREPTERFFSGIAHARRRREDPATFTPAMRAMRSMAVEDFLRSEDGRQEARLQLVLLGSDHRRPFHAYTDSEMLERALALVGRPEALFAPCESSDVFARLLAARFGFRPRPLGRLNANTAEDYLGPAGEFRAALPLLEAENAAERQLYRTVRDRFAAFCAAPGIPRRRGLALSPARTGTPPAPPPPS